MTDKIKAQISAFVDDELVDGESELLIRRLCADTELRHAAARYGLIGNAIRGSLDEIRADLSTHIMRKIEAEEPASVPAVAIGNASRARGVSKMLAGGLIAATVATVAIMSLQSVNAPDVTPSFVAQEKAITVPETSSNNEPFVRQTVTPGLRQASSNQNLQRYLLRHSQYATTVGRQGVLTYRSLGIDDANAPPYAGPDQDLAVLPQTDQQ